ncbi:MAG: mechanosensitive ion channel domain-containing protein [Mariniphaga sp.]
MKQLIISFSLLLICFGVFAQSDRRQNSQTSETKTVLSDSAKKASDAFWANYLKMMSPDDAKGKLRNKFILSVDSLTMSDYTLSIERVNDNLNTISDSAKLGFNVVKMGRRIGSMTDDVQRIRQNVRGRNTVINIKNLYLYQSYSKRLYDETNQIQDQVDKLYNTVFQAKKNLKLVLSDSIFRKLYSDKKLRNTFDQQLVRLEKKYLRTDSTTRANVDSLNSLKVRLSDNSVNLSSTLNSLDRRMDKAASSLFGQEVVPLWGKQTVVTPTGTTSKLSSTIVTSELNAIGYFVGQVSKGKIILVILGILLFIWLFLQWKLLKILGNQNDTYRYLNLKYLNNRPVLSLILVLLCMTPFFDGYAPTSYISIVHLILLIVTTLIFWISSTRTFLLNWFALAAFFVLDVALYFLIEPNFVERLLLMAIHSGILFFCVRFYLSLHNQITYNRFLKWASMIGSILAGFAILLNLFGRFSLSGIVGIASIYAVTQAIILTIFIDVIAEIYLVQLQMSRLKRGNNLPFDVDSKLRKINPPLIFIALLVWLIMVTSNLNLFHSTSNFVMDSLTSTRTIGSITFQWLSVLLFIVIIWIAHLLQRMVSFIFGDSESEEETITKTSKGQHSRLLITRLIVLIGGYLLAIAASGLPIDKLTFLLGALGVGIGMGLQHIVNNVVSGVILIFDGTLQIGDEIEVTGQAGKVKEIGLRASTLTTSDGADVIIPNGSILSSNIVNWTFTNNEKRVILTFTISGNELDANVINEVINNTLNNLENVIVAKPPVILYSKVTSVACLLNVRFWSTISHADQVKSDAMRQLSAAFTARKFRFR